MAPFVLQSDFKIQHDDSMSLFYTKMVLSSFFFYEYGSFKLVYYLIEITVPFGCW